MAAAVALFALGLSAPAVGDASTDAGRNLPWKSLVFEGQTHVIRSRIEASLERLPSQEAVPSLRDSPQGKPVRPGGLEVVLINTASSAEGPFVGRERREMTVWFDPLSGAALQRDRLRRGKKPDNKLYRYTEQGVYRLRRKPRDDGEVALSPAGWTRTKESFYSYPAQVSDCGPVADPSILLYKLSVMPLTDPDVVSEMCIFHQQHVHRVSLEHQGEQRLEVNFGQGPREITAVRVVLQARPLEQDQNDENFAFLGLEGDIEILLDRDARIPVRITGSLPKLGRASFNLSKALGY